MNTNDTWYAIRALFGDRCFKTESDAGGVKVGNDSFSVRIPNGFGDGITRCAVFEAQNETVTELMEYFTTIDGTFNIYDYDCGTKAARTLTGRYAVYFYDGLVAFVKQNY